MQRIHDAMVEAFEVAASPVTSLTEHDPSKLVLAATGPGFERSDSRVLVQMFTRSKQKFCELAARYLYARLNIAPPDIKVSCVDNADVDWSLGYGRARFLKGEG